MNSEQCTCPVLDHDGTIIYKVDYRISLVGAPQKSWIPTKISARQAGGRLRHPKYLFCAKHAVTYDLARLVLQFVHSKSASQRHIETCIALAISQPSVASANGPYMSVLSIAARKTADGGCSFGVAARGATYIVRAICLTLVDLPFGDYLLAYLLSFIVGDKATAALLRVTTTGSRFTEKTKSKVLQRRNEKTSLESLVIAVRRSAAHIRQQRPQSDDSMHAQMFCRNCGSHDIAFANKKMFQQQAQK